MLSVNDKAPDFILKNTNKDDVKLSDFSDKTVVLAFYPGAYTGVCDSEMCALQDNLKSFNDLNAIVLGISVDSPWANGAFSKQYNLEFDLLSDSEKIMGKLYGVNSFYFFPQRKTFLINEEGKLVHVIDSVNIDSHANDILEIFKKIQGA